MENIMMLTTIAVALITAVLGPIAVAWAKKQFHPKSTPTPINDAIQANTLVDNQLDIIMDDLGSDRVWVSQFHNGGHFYPTNKSIAKFSIFYEKTTQGTVASQQTFQNIPCSLFSKSLFHLAKEGEIAATNLQDETYGLCQISNQYNSKSFYMIALEDLNGHFIGVLSISYNKEYKFTKDDWIYTRQKAGVIGTLLDEYLNIKK
tara:strand:- start:1354 stop:1965 length:612 start_codon:yes stop_codon:yes gene_type:complete